MYNVPLVFQLWENPQKKKKSPMKRRCANKKINLIPLPTNVYTSELRIENLNSGGR